MKVGARIGVLLALLALFLLAQVPAWMVLFTDVPHELLTRQLLLASLLAMIIAGFGVFVLVRYMQAHVDAAAQAPMPLQHVGGGPASLTGLPGRRQLDKKLYDAIDHARHNHQQFAVLLLDTEGFKDINDTLGHAIGDRVLIEIAKRLRQEAHPNDTVAHFGGDNFVVLIESVRDAEEVQRAAMKLDAALSKPISVENLDLHVEVRFGVVIYPANGETAEALVRRADIARYDAKHNHETVHFYENGRDSRHMYHLSLAHELHDAVPDNQFRLHYQPRLTLATGRIEDMEALLRWQHPNRGMISPDDFIPLAERSGSIKMLTDWALQEALRQIRVWSDMGVRAAVGLNVSAVDLGNEDLPERLRRYIQQHGVDPDLLIIEVTETALMRDIDRALLMLNRLKDCGVRLAIDDYGSGYSSLSYLKRLPVDELKIDKAFVMGMATDKDDATIVRSTIELSHAMGLKMVAEGIEDATSLRMLHAMGCDTGQGYLISKPLPADATTDMLKRDHAHGGIPELTSLLQD